MDTGEMRAYYRGVMLLDAKAMEETAGVVESLDERGYRADYGARLKAATETAAETLAEADDARLKPAYDPATEKAVLLRRAAEARRLAETMEGGR